MNNLEKAIMIYLQYDQKADNRFHDPSPANVYYHNRVKKDAKNIAKIASDLANTVPPKRRIQSFLKYIKPRYTFTDDIIKISEANEELVFKCIETGNIFTESEVIVKWMIYEK